MNSLRSHIVLSVLSRTTTGSTTLQQVRWKRREPVRKLRWLPRAPSKLYRVFQPPELPEDEVLQWEHLNRVYYSKTQSISRYFHQAFYKPSLTAGGKSSEQIERELREDEQLIAENEVENRAVALGREQRLRREHELAAEELLTKDSQHQTEAAQRVVEAMEVVAKEVKRSTSYITRQSLDAAIEEALANPVSYDYHIDKGGRIHVAEARDLHPYALRPMAVPETSSNVGVIDQQQQQQGELKFTAKKLY